MKQDLSTGLVEERPSVTKIDNEKQYAIALILIQSLTMTELPLSQYEVQELERLAKLAEDYEKEQFKEHFIDAVWGKGE